MLYATDAKGYYSVGSWIYSGTETNHTITRPLLYPAIIGLLFKINYGWVIVFQFLCWLLSVNLLYAGAKKVFNSLWPPIFFAAFVGLNFTLIALTFHALTELITVFFLSVLVYLVCARWKGFDQQKFWIFSSLLLALLSVVRPVFYPILLLWLLFIGIFHFKQLFGRPKILVYMALVLSPVLFQMGFMYQKHGIFKISDIGTRTINNYYVTRVYSSVNGTDKAESFKQIEHNSTSENMSYLMQHKKNALKVFIGNVNESVNGAPIFTMIPNKEKNFFWFWMNKINGLFAYVFFMGIPFVIAYLWKLYRRKETYFMAFFLLISIVYLVTLSCGLSYYQGDRLFVPLVAVWPFVYWVSVKNTLVVYMQNRIKTNQ